MQTCFLVFDEFGHVIVSHVISSRTFDWLRVKGKDRAIYSDVKNVRNKSGE